MTDVDELAFDFAHVLEEELANALIGHVADLLALVDELAVLRAVVASAVLDNSVDDGGSQPGAGSDFGKGDDDFSHDNTPELMIRSETLLSLFTLAICD